jgi:hypothetical protein
MDARCIWMAQADPDGARLMAESLADSGNQGVGAGEGVGILR